MSRQRGNEPPVTWLDALTWCREHGEDAVMITVRGAQGSTPREAGAKMVVTPDACFDTIGGGNLEQQAVIKARQMLEDGQRIPLVERFNLAANLGMCCGGVAMLMLEPLMLGSRQLVIFGAGHVGLALVTILSALPYRIHWVDSREGQFPDDIPANVTTYCDDDPVGLSQRLPDKARYLIMTHNHQLDLDLCMALLKRPRPVGFVGLIGSAEKWRRFQQRMEQRGFAPQQIASICCPVGLPDIGGKRPMEVAVSIAAQQLQLDKAEAGQSIAVTPLNWQAARSIGTLSGG